MTLGENSKDEERLPEEKIMNKDGDLGKGNGRKLFDQITLDY